jgi:hypothetical protein
MVNEGRPGGPQCDRRKFPSKMSREEFMNVLKTDACTKILAQNVAQMLRLCRVHVAQMSRPCRA